jgi:Secretion system C-terminal sorting domain/YHYH protein
MKNVLSIVLCLVSHTLFAHSGNETHTTLKEWSIPTENKTVKASLMMLKDKTVFLENGQHAVVKYPLSALTLEDQLYVIQKYKQIEKLNTPLMPVASSRQGVTVLSTKKALDWRDLLYQNLWFSVWFSTLLMIFSVIKLYKKKFAHKLAYYGILLSITSIFFSFMPKPILGTDPLFIDSAFAPFKSKVKTRWDATYFYVESVGLPTHTMMKGITNWQQQVPTPKCYTGANAWSIPLNPVVAATPTPTKTNFFKGAIAIAANGIPIFNALNNRGEDSYLIGELDLYGGHCGKGDDYHYHVAPLSLDSINSAILPIAFALDGFAVYAAKEPNGVAMTALDANHGHYLNGVYHYHGTTDYPYMVGNMVGVVTKDATDQIVPQPTGQPFRPAGNPLNGAAITNCVANATNNGYNLTYTLSNQTYNINYSWTAAGVFTFNFVSPTGTTMSNYNGQICTITSPTNDLSSENNQVKIYPNPTKTGFSLDFRPPFNVNDVKSISIFDVKGSLISTIKEYKSFIETPDFRAGVYFVKIQFSNSQLTKKLIVQ